jgi:hypothetical protein
MTRKSFSISYLLDVILTTDELWPDGDGPANATEEDVELLISKSGGMEKIISSWNLSDDGQLTVSELEKSSPLNNVKRS